MAACAVALATCFGSACADDVNGMDASDGQCLSELALDCSPTFHPEFDAIYEHVLATTCASAATGGSCHGPEGAKGGLILADPDRAYSYLMGEEDGRARVIAGEPECSILVQRLESEDPAFRMPVGNMRLSEGVRCAVRQWIAQGAVR